MDQRKKELREQYMNRRPDMGVVCWTCGEHIWAAVTTDAAAEYNSTVFQLKLGSWPNREMQRLYNQSPDAFQWSLAKKLKYEDPTKDYSDDLQLLMLEFVDEHPEAQPMSPRKKWK